MSNPLKGWGPRARCEEWPAWGIVSVPSLIFTKYPWPRSWNSLKTWETEAAVCLVYSVCSFWRIMLWTSAGPGLLFFLSYFFLPEWMQGNLKDIPSNLLSCQCETFNILLCRKKEDCRCKTVHLFNFLLPTKGKLTQVETWKMRTKSMSESVLAALVKCPLHPSGPSGPSGQPPPAAALLP